MGVNQWPDFDLSQFPRTIRRVLLEEGSGLKEKTEELLHFVVETIPTGEGGFTHECYLVAPHLDYRYPFLRVTQGSDPYPVTIAADSLAREITAANEAELIAALGSIFRAEETKKTVLQLLDAVS